jgi:hypothetical protein
LGNRAVDSAEDIARRFRDATGLSKITTNASYHLVGAFEIPDQKIAGSFEVFQKDAKHQWVKVEIPQHGKYLRARNGEVMWHFDPPPNSRAGDGWFVYERPGYVYEINEAQRRIHETFNIYDSLNLTGEPKSTAFQGRDAFELTNAREGGRSSTEIFDAANGLRIALTYPEPKSETALLNDYKEWNGLKFPSRFTSMRAEKTNEVFTVKSITFEDVKNSKFAMPLRVRDWPAKWNEFDEAYPPPSFVTERWPWKGEHSRYFHPGFGEANSPFFWSYVVFNALDGDTLKTAEELKDALHRYDSALYGKSFSPEKIKIEVSGETTEQKLGHQVTRRTVRIDGFDAEATNKPLTTHLQVFRWYCPVADRTGMLVLRSPRNFSEDDEVWKTLLGFWKEAECHPEPK